MPVRDDKIHHFKAFIDGPWVEAASGARFESEDPYTGRIWASIPRCDAADAERAVRAARATFECGAWADCTPLHEGLWCAAWAI